MNIPNVLSYSRIVLVILNYLFLFQNKTMFSIIFVLIGLTDVFDGFFARLLNQQTNYGAKLDTVADIVLTSSIIVWFVMLFPEFFKTQLVLSLTLISVFVLVIMFHFVRHKSLGSLHLWSSKFFAVMLFLFFLHAIIYDVSTIFFYVLFTVGIVRCIEEFGILILNKNPPMNTKTIFHLKWNR
ncbi:hypothetical protein COV11_04290 [Candidatus Woesearchaeota archaeon CG10_big_fil_rev_8_21_14_0_10_30_7]|nr:MAG: hypothetical protein COV11_04290 [Candidatus Woesearchaeota archaeon CG10_big_fil_rev_8_21_14_0_10_30_7]